MARSIVWVLYIMKLNLGCGSDIRPDWINADVRKSDGVDVVMDINRPWSFPDGSFDEVVCLDVLEHGTDKVFLMNELWRVCKHGARVTIETPNMFSNPQAWADPTHRLVWHPENWDFTHPAHSFRYTVGSACFITLSHGHSPMRLKWTLKAYKEEDEALLKQHVEYLRWAASEGARWYRQAIAASTYGPDVIAQ